MSHNIGRVVTIAPLVIGPGGSAPPTSPGVWEHTFVPQPATSGGPPRWVILHLTAMSIPAGSRVEVPLGYATDVFTSGTEAWTRPIDTASPIVVRFVGGPGGSVTLGEYGSGEPFATVYTDKPTWNNTTNCDLFLHTNPYQEPSYESRVRCGTTHDFRNVAKDLVPGSVEEQAASAVGIFVHAGHMHEGVHVLTSCSGTLIDTTVFLTAKHCLTDPLGRDVLSGSVTFDFQTDANGARPAGYAPRFWKVRRVVDAGNAMGEDGDWVLLELEEPPAGVTPRPLRGTAPMPNEPVFTVHHPNGAVKKIQNGALGAGGALSGISGFDYAGGSSGSPLFDLAGNVLGAALSNGGQCSVAYATASSVLQAIATVPAPPAPYDVMLVIDRSGSMSGAGTSGATKMVEAREAASLFVQLVRLNGGDKLGMVSFSTTASNPVDEPPGNVNPGQKNQLVGPAPYTGGKIGGLAPGGNTTIGGGLQRAMSVLPAGANKRAIVLMTDGMHNTAPSVATAEGSLGDTVVHAIGFGTEAQLDGALLNGLAHRHGGMYTRAKDGLHLKKFFALCFGNIFEAGMLADPELVLGAGVDEMTAVEFAVLDEERVTAVVGWETPEQRLVVELVTPGGAVVPFGAPGTESDSGMTWQFLRLALPHAGEREGTWRVRVRRPSAVPVELARASDGRKDAIRYVVSVLADGGPRLDPVNPPRRLYTGDVVNPKVALRYGNGSVPEHGEAYVDVERLDGSLGALVQQAGIGSPTLGEEPVGAFAATLQRIERESGGTLPIATVTERVTLYDDAAHDDGALEPDGVFGNPRPDLLRYEGTYTFRAVVTYGHGPHQGRREAFWSVHVLPGIDPDRTEAEEVAGGIRIRPRDRYGNPLGPGRGDAFDVTGVPGTVVTGPVRDNGDGSYDVPTEPAGGTPGVVVTQPDREPVVVVPGGWPGGEPGPEPGPDGRTGCLLWLVVALAVLAAVLAVVLVLGD